MKKKFFKLLKRHTYTVLLTLIFCALSWNYFTTKAFETMQELSEKAIQVKIDSVKNAEITKLTITSLNHERENLERLKLEYRREAKLTNTRRRELTVKFEQVDKHILLQDLLTSLRTDFGAIEPGVQISNDEEYMKIYRQHESTLALAIDLAKRLNVYDEYKEFFSNRVGIWNMVTSR